MSKSPFSEKFIVVTHIATTGDEHQVCVSKDVAEVIEIAWIILDAASLTEIARESILVRPINTPVTDLCTSATTLAWHDLENAMSFKDAVHKFEAAIQAEVLDKSENFAFIALDSWDLRVQVTREARDKSVGLPSFFQYPRLYTIRQEYMKWQMTHPEALSSGASSVANICAALGIDMSTSNTSEGKHPSTSPFANSQPRRASTECINIASILRALIKRSGSTVLDNQLFKSPLDAKMDIDAFLSEESKVLHLSGLAFDTTQSELESWFTQHGGRPIAFWTLRTPDQQKPTGTGFAVFSSHQETADSLILNGRSLNERTIEVSPSSPRVLDRAADILMPFPPSKNRPRPGDWTCPSCGFSNFQRRTACFRCSYPSSSSVSSGMAGLGPPQLASGIDGGGRSGGNGYYASQNMHGGMASLTHLPHQQHNQHNQGQRHQQAYLQQQHQHQHQYQQHHGQLYPQPMRGMGGAGSAGAIGAAAGIGAGIGGGGGGNSVPFRAGDWSCVNCAFHNFARNFQCLKCGCERDSRTML